MNYPDALAWLYGAQTFGIKLGLENIRRLLQSAGNPHEQLRFIHVAGTNGKGSTCAMLDSVLRASGLRSGLYTSPHLVDFRERIRLGGAMVPERDVAEGLTMLRDAARGWKQAPTFFEIATALAAWWFAREGAEVVVWETGLGGRLDATNAVTPLVSAIAPVGLDHQQWLGESIEEIAREKAGILKPGVPAVSAPQPSAARAVLEARAAEVGAPLRFVADAYRGALGLAGAHQRWNAALALAALDAAGLARDADARSEGLASVVWPARFQRVGDDVVIDGAHNPAGAEALVETWREVFGQKRARLVFGALRDKDSAALLRRLREIADEVWLVTVANPRAVSSGELRALAEDAGFVCVREAGVAAALAAARAAGGPALVAGSLFLAGEALAVLEGQPAPAVSAQ